MFARLFSLSRSRSLLLSGALAGMAFAATASYAQDPPGASRLSHLQGNVSLQPNGEDSWGQAASNMPIGPGDRVFTDQQGRGELQAGPTRTYFSPGTDLTLVNFNGQGVELGIASGSILVYTDGFLPGQSLFISTPNGGVSVPGANNFRIDVYPDQQSTIITGINGALIQLNGAGGYAFNLGGKQAVQLSGVNPVYSQFVQASPGDEFSSWAANIDSHRYNSVAGRYVSLEMHGYDELDGNGDWQAQSEYGPIWFPRVQAGWAPYHYGHWVNMQFYGWTWVADEPWGAAPFHYGRWVAVGGRWGWIPGPRESHPIWSPAQVVFAGGIQFGGGGVSVWFPLGPGEPYHPWYPCTPEYINQINITNIHESASVHVQVNYNIVNVTNITYVNRTSVVAMRQEDFASGRSAQSAPVKIDPAQIPQHIQPARPEAKPPAQRVILHPVAKPAAAPAARPVLINHEGKQMAASPMAKPVAVPVKATPPPKPIPGHTPVGAPSIGGKPAPELAKPAGEPGKMTPPSKMAAPLAPVKPAAPEAKPETKPEAKAESKPEAKPAAKPPAKDDKKKKDDKKEDKKPE